MLEAMARRDDSEADRLEDTCPQPTYRCGTKRRPRAEAVGEGEREQVDAADDEEEDLEDASCLAADFASRMAVVEQRAERATELTARALARAGEPLAEELRGVWDAF